MSYYFVEANYWWTQSIAQPLCNSRATCNRYSHARFSVKSQTLFNIDRVNNSTTGLYSWVQHDTFLKATVGNKARRVLLLRHDGLRRLGLARRALLLTVTYDPLPMPNVRFILNFKLLFLSVQANFAPVVHWALLLTVLSYCYDKYKKVS